MATLRVTNLRGRSANVAPDLPDGANITGVTTSTTFVGALTGNVTGTASGLAGSPDITVASNTVGKQLTAEHANVTGVSTFNGDVTFKGDAYDVLWDKSTDDLKFPDNATVKFGTGNDLSIYHNGTHGYISNDTGDLILGAGNGTSIKLQPEGGEDGLTVNQNGAVDLYYDNSKKLETISTGASVYGGLRLQGGGLIRENVNISATALNSDKVINLSQGMVHYRSAAVGAANVKLNVISTAGINTDMAIGDALTLTVITVAGSASHFVDQLRIDGVEATAGVTTHWVGGSAPTDGGASGVDTYSFNIIKTANAAYLAVANKVATS